MALSLTRLRRSFVVLSLLLAGALALSAAPAAISADDDTRSIEQFQPITISEQTFFDLEGIVEELDPLTMLMIFMQLQDLGEFDTNLDKNTFYDVDSLDELNTHLDADLTHPVDLPARFDASDAYYTVSDSGYASATLNVAVARSITQLLDLPPEWLPSPAEHETVTLRVDVPAAGMIGYRSGFEKLMVGQVGLPEIDVPEEVDLELLRDAIIDDPRMPDELADQLGAIDDWDETMPVPVPEGADYEDLTINGNAGFALTMDREGGVVAWESDETLHFVAGNLTVDELQEIAEAID